jgi:hypothetical protein
MNIIALYKILPIFKVLVPKCQTSSDTGWVIASSKLGYYNFIL